MSFDYEIYKEGGILNDRYQKVDDISEGSYGYVSLAKDLKLKKLVAIKYIFKLDNDYNDDDNDQRENINNGIDPTDCSSEKKHELDQQLQNKKSLISDAVKSRFSNNVCFEAMYEVDIQTKVGKHRNVAELLDFFDSYIIMEYCTGGDLYEAIKDDIVPRKTKSITYIISQIMDAIEFVHTKGIYHRDIKPENILITGIDWTIKLTDWGLATTDENSMDRSVGSERYMSPELFESNLDMNERNEPYDCSKVDLWAMGIVFLNIVFHKNPFSIADQTDKSFCYFAANREALFDVFSSMTYDFFQVLRYCLTIDPTNRDLAKMREELNNLSEYTFDDEYYNSLEDEYDIPMSSDASSIKISGSDVSTTPPSETKLFMPPSSAPVALPTPINSSKPLPQIKNDDFEIKHDSSQSTTATNDTKYDTFKKPYDIPKFKINAQNDPSHTTTTTYDHKFDENQNNRNNYKPNTNSYYNNVDQRERAKSVPKIKFNRRPRVKNNHNQYHISPTNYNNNNASHNYKGNNNNISNNNNNGYYNTHYKAFRMRRRNKSKIIKHSRKPLGIPTPNTHINNYINDYRAKEDNQFNTRDFFTPPSVQHRYMEGIYDNKNRYHRQQYKNNHLNVHNNYNNNDSNNGSNNSNYSKSWNNNKSSKFRRPSTTGNQAFSTNFYSGNRSRHSFHSSNMTSGNVFKRTTVQHSPGSYIPPNARCNFPTSTSVGVYSSQIPNISSVLGESDNEGLSNERNKQLPATSMLNSAIDNEHDLDDTLFSLDDGDHDYIDNMNNLSLNDGMQHNNNVDNMNRMSDTGNAFRQLHALNVNIPNHQPIHSNNDSDLPDLLKSPVISSTSLNTAHGYNKPMSNNQYLNIPSDMSQGNAHHKPGVYVPPHHRRSSGYSTNEAVLSVSPNSISIQKAELHPSQTFKKPSIPIGNSGTTVALQDHDVFRYSDNDALIFEDDDDDDDVVNDTNTKYMNDANSNRARRSFGPYKIYDDDDENNTKLNAYRSNRRTSSIQNEVVGSLEQYKNNWLMLQQPQE
ncbi:similar to Saccharomyces cerevisiae YHR082C KSP1 Ser/thr protein kinase [Maudiozyma barnettii]|uniref:non-specific serine/threonine protein kinase n=1 Tax=Maudiozyma barnettii TaxID=61262 RepID=A0A8H2ZFG5_9SACH|nr:putative serine/threonine protein kinase KSP1 [Kazachstania barnettii]CAB4252340.1 similar to Saccharomyces cerevisiae YHR082C KSP1 Ser/thr protein kinase [Kazachstania barnettii]CAD1779074.1 similar to Saccharomyces cerevisiae YHR082C KSP1 Ser/thr protein kinase [Kazachstania barnettii]